MKDQVQDGSSHEIPLVENATTTEVVLEPDLEKEESAMMPLVNKRRRKRGNDEAEANAPPKVLRKDHAAFCPAQSTLGGKSLASIGLDAGSIFFTPTTKDVPTAAKSVSDPDPLSYAKLQPHPKRDVAQSSRKMTTEIPTGNVATTEVQGMFSTEGSASGKSTSFPSMDGSPGGIYQPEWGVTNNYRVDTLDACQDMVDHIVPPGYFFVLRHLSNNDFLSQYNINLTRQVAMGSQLRLRFEPEAKLLKKATAKIARQDQRIQVREKEIKKLDQEIKSLRAVEAKVHDLHNQTKNLESLLEAEVSNLQVQVTGEEKIKASFEEFKKYKDVRVEQCCAKMDARLDKLSMDFDEELYPHMLIAIAGRRWVIRHGLRLAVMKWAESIELRQAFADVVSAELVKGMSEGLKHSIEHGKAGQDLVAIEAYNPEADNKYVKALQDLKDLKYSLVDQLERLKDPPMDLIVASLHLESDSGEDAPSGSMTFSLAPPN
ncbi:hypothetical protein Tco_1575331 [Tanacetum coccineum]